MSLPLSRIYDTVPEPNQALPNVGLMEHSISQNIAAFVGDRPTNDHDHSHSHDHDDHKHHRGPKRRCGRQNQPSSGKKKRKRKRPMCKHDDCTKQPSFNFPGETRPLYCKEHAKPGMMDVVNRKCIHTGCVKKPSYNYPGEKRAVFCKLHAHHKMVNVRTRKCRHSGCTKQPSYNYPGQKRPMFCREHAHPTMIIVINRTCRYIGCNKKPLFNLEGEVQGITCRNHADPRMVDVVNARCGQGGCHTQPRYGNPGHPPTVCTRHRKAGMILRPRRRCEVKDCREVALYGIRGATHCIIHKYAEQVNFVGKTCVSCGLVDIVDDDGRCATCDPELSKRVRLAKQREVRLWLDHNSHDDYILYDRAIDQGMCGKERPDFAWDCKTHVLVLEVDEDQHRDRQASCEVARMVNISQSFGMPTVFLRYNPDSFKQAGSSRNPSNTKRKDVLLRWIAALKSQRPQSFLSVIHLFFDNFNEQNVQNECLMSFEE